MTLPGVDKHQRGPWEGPAAGFLGAASWPRLAHSPHGTWGGGKWLCAWPLEARLRTGTISQCRTRGWSRGKGGPMDFISGWEELQNHTTKG